MKFQTKVEGLLQALTRKHILSQKPLRGGEEVKRALWWRGGESLAPCVMGSGRLLLKTGWILAREAGPGFGTDEGEAETKTLKETEGFDRAQPKFLPGYCKAWY